MAQQLLQINFKFSVTREEFEGLANELASSFAELDGLRWKVWLMNEKESEAGGIYLFEDEASLKSYLDGPLAAQVISAGASIQVGPRKEFGGGSRAIGVPCRVDPGGLESLIPQFRLEALVPTVEASPVAPGPFQHRAKRSVPAGKDPLQEAGLAAMVPEAHAPADPPGDTLLKKAVTNLSVFMVTIVLDDWGSATLLDQWLNSQPEYGVAEIVTSAPGPNKCVPMDGIVDPLP